MCSIDSFVPRRMTRRLAIVGPRLPSEHIAQKSAALLDALTTALMLLSIMIMLIMLDI